MKIFMNLADVIIIIIKFGKRISGQQDLKIADLVVAVYKADKIGDFLFLAGNFLLLGGNGGVGGLNF